MGFTTSHTTRTKYTLIIRRKLYNFAKHSVVSITIQFFEMTFLRNYFRSTSPPDYFRGVIYYTGHYFNETCSKSFVEIEV